MIRSPLIQKLDLFALLSFLVPFSIYLMTLAPSVTFFDSGEFLTAIYSLGTAHSPGYPLFINYAKPFTYLPFGSIAFRVNIATAVSAAAACYGVYLLVTYLLKEEKLTDNASYSTFFIKMSAFCAALTFAFSARLWLQSNHDKPYPLVSFLAAMVFYLLLRWREHYRQGVERPAYVYLGAFLCGLAFGAHQTIILMLPSYAFLIVSMDWRLITRIKEIILAVTFGILGFAIHLHSIVRATQNPLLNWGDPKNLTQFLWNLLRKGYPVEKPVRDLNLLWAQINAFNIPFEFTGLGLALILFGMFVYRRKVLYEIAAYAIAIAVFLMVIVGYFNTPGDLIFLTEEFFTPIYLFSAVFIGIGLFALLKLVTKAFSPERLFALPVKGALVALLLCLPVTVCALNYVENDQHENYIAFDYATNTLRTLPQEAILYTWGDSGAFPLWYLQGVERMREDTDLLHTPHLVFPWYLDGFPLLFKNSFIRSVPLETTAPENILKISIAEQINKRPIMVDFSTRYSVQFDEFSLVQRGICYRVENRKGTMPKFPELSAWDLYTIRGTSGDMFFRDLDTSKAILIYANSHIESGEMLLRYGRLAEGISQLRSAAEVAPEVGGQVRQLLGAYGVR